MSYLLPQIEPMRFVIKLLFDAICIIALFFITSNYLLCSKVNYVLNYSNENFHSEIFFPDIK